MNRLLQPRLWPLRTQARVLVCVLLGAMALGSGHLWGQRSAAQIEADAGTQLLQTARAMADRLSREMAARAQDVRLLSGLDVLRNTDDRAATRAALEKLQASLPAFAWIGMTDAEGTVIAATGDILLGKSIASRPVFQNGRKGLWTGDVHEAVLLASLVPHSPGEEAMKFVDVAAPVVADDGSLTGVLALHLSWQWADLLRKSVLKPHDGSETLQISIVGANGQWLLEPRQSRESANLPFARLKSLNERWGSERWSDGREDLTAVAESRPQGEFAGLGWRVVARDIDGPTLTAISNARRNALAWSLGLGLVCALLACWAIGRLVAPVEQVAQALQPQETSPPVFRGVRPQRRNDVQQIAVAVSKLQQALKDREEAVHSMAQKAHRDSLTGLWNRQYLSELEERLMTELTTRDLELCVLCLDLDGFKPVNDKYGHNAGDQVLVQIAKRLRQAAREEDFVFRMGGDEFMLLLVCPTGEGAELSRAVSARLLADVRRPMTYRTLSNLKVDCSIGSARWSKHGSTLAEVMQRADEALYTAKRSGRGQLRQYVGDNGESQPAAA